MQIVSETLEKLRASSNRSLLKVFGLVAGLAVLVGWFVASPQDRETVISSPASTTSDDPPAQLPQVFVHISGAVKNPGVYQALSGSRLFEIVALAGGFIKTADQSSVNLARTVEDGEQIIVSLQAREGSSVGVASSGVSQNSAKLRLNIASAQELESLPGVGPKLAGRIIDWRTANGGFAHIADLLDVGGIGDKLYAAIKPMVAL